jgi:hypothetical protein
MRITGEVVRTISKYARALSNNYVAEVQVGSDIGHGARIMDGNSQVVWLSKPREAAAYYLGQVDAFAAARGIILADYPAEVAEARAEVLPRMPSRDTASGPGRPTNWYELGRSDGEARIKYYCPEIVGAGEPN